MAKLPATRSSFSLWPQPPRAYLDQHVANTYPKKADGSPLTVPELCARFGMNAEEVYTVFVQACEDPDLLTRRQRIVFSAMRHPVFLDLPDMPGLWVMADAIMRSIGIQPNTAPLIAPEDIFFYMQSIPQRLARALLTETPAKDVKGDEAKLRAALVAAQVELRNKIRAREGAPDEGEVIPQRIREKLETASLTMERRGDAVHMADATVDAITRKRIIGLYDDFAAFDPQFISDLTRNSNNELGACHVVAERLNGLRGGKGKFITPRDVFDTVFVRTKPIEDPVFHSWCFKITKNDKLTLHANWEARATRHGNYNSVVLPLLKRLDNFKEPLPTLKDVADYIGVEVQILTGFLTTTKPHSLAWEAKDGAWVPKTGGVFEKLLVMLEFEKPEDLLPPPELPPPAPKSAMKEVVVRAALKDAPPPSPWAGFEEAEALFGKTYENPEAIIGKTLAYMGVLGSGQEQEARAALTFALQNPGAMVEEEQRGEGKEKHKVFSPSLPHLWLSWALGDTAHKEFGEGTAFFSLVMTFDPEQHVFTDDRLKQMEASYFRALDKGRLLPATPQDALHWTALQLAHRQKEDGIAASIVQPYNLLRAAGFTGDAERQWGLLNEFVSFLASDEALPNRPSASLRDKNRELAGLLTAITEIARRPDDKGPSFARIFGTSGAGHAQARVQQIMPPTP